MALMTDAGYAGRSVSRSLLIKTGAQVLFLGADNTVSAANGFQIAAGVTREIPGIEIDLAGIWLFITAGDTIEIFAQSV